MIGSGHIIYISIIIIIEIAFESECSVKSDSRVNFATENETTIPEILSYEHQAAK